MGTVTIAALVVVVLLIAGFVGFALRDDNDVDMDDVRGVGRRLRGEDDNERPPRRE